MIIFREHPLYFLALKYVQLLFSFLVVIFEITQYASYGKYYTLTGQHNDWFEWEEGDSNGVLKIWLLIVCSLSILNLAYILTYFKKIWDNGSNVWIEIFFSALWLSAGLSNLNPVHKGANDLNCRSPLEEQSPKQFICNLWVTSSIIGWFIFGTFILTTFISWQLPKEIQEKKRWIEKCYSSDSYNNDRRSYVSPRFSPVPQPIVTIQNNSSDELEKGGVPELLLQSGLPADHRMSLKIVLPKSGPFGQISDDSSQQQQTLQQQKDQTNNDLTPLPPQINASTLTLPDIKQHNVSNLNHLIVPSKKSTEVSSLHEVPL